MGQIGPRIDQIGELVKDSRLPKTRDELIARYQELREEMDKVDQAELALQEYGVLQYSEADTLTGSQNSGKVHQSWGSQSESWESADSDLCIDSDNWGWGSDGLHQKGFEEDEGQLSKTREELIGHSRALRTEMKMVELTLQDYGVLQEDLKFM